MRGIGRTRSRARDAAARGASYLSRARPVPLLAALCGIQLAITAWFAFETPHNGFVWYSGGDATEYWTGEWAVAHLHLTQTVIGWGLPVFYAWVPLVTGTTLLSGLPVIVLLQALVLVPLSVILFWLVADRLFGRLYAWGATALWIVGPLLLLWGMRHDYRLQFEQNFLAPHVYGLTNMADFPSLVLVLACAWATLRALDSDRMEEWLFAGLLTGVAIGVKPANAFFVVAVVVLLALCLRVRGAALFGIALLPALVTLIVWKQRGLGNLPLFAIGQAREASGPVVAADSGKYVPLDLHHLGMELRDLMEVFWSVRLLEWMAVAGAIAALRRGRARGAFLAVWFVMFCVVKGSSDQASMSTTSYFRLTEPGLPAFALLVAAIVYLVPARRRHVSALPPRRVSRWVIAATAVIGGVVPLAFVLAVRPQQGEGVTLRDNQRSTEAPISAGWTARRSGNRLTWSPIGGHGTRVHYLVLRVDPATGGCTPPESGARECYLEGTPVTTTRATSVVVPKTSATYRVAAAANYLDEANGGDLMLLGPPVTVP